MSKNQDFCIIKNKNRKKYTDKMSFNKINIHDINMIHTRYP